MAAERLAPDALALATNLSGTVAAIQDDPDSPDGAWLTTTSGGASDLRVTFPSPTGNPTTGAGLQNFRAQIRKNASGGNNCGWSLELWENGVSVSVLSTGTTASTTGEVIAGAWDAASLGTANGSLVECRLLQTSGSGGSPSGRRYLETGAVEWNADYSLGSIAGTLNRAIGDITASAAGDVALAGSLSKSIGDVTLDATATMPNAGISGSLSKSIGDVSASSASRLSLRAALSRTIGAITGAASSTVRLAGSAAKSIGSVIGSAAAALGLKGQAQKSIGSIEPAATADVALAGALNQSIGGIALSAPAGEQAPKHQAKCQCDGAGAVFFWGFIRR